MVTRLKQPHVSSSSTETSSESKNSLNGDNGRKDTTERRLAKPKTNSGTSLISQRSIQPSLTAPPSRPNGLRQDMSNDTLANTSANDEDEEDKPPQTNGVSREALTSNAKDVWASVPRPTLRAHYKLHNPLGPRWYRNHHLIPPSHFKPSMRPPTFFSSSFPPIGTASHDYPDNDEDPSRSPSHSPLPTPESSQTRVQDGSKPRSRKTSQTAPDAIDMLDLSDPWGQNWHHQSPYEFGQITTVASLDTTDLPNRTRRASFSVAHARQISVAPSPLSQSTSAVNLPSLQPEIKPPRKLSKRKTTNVTTVFQDPPPPVDRKALSVPTTPIDAPVLPSAPVASDILRNPTSTSPAGPFMSTPSPIPKREKRGSLLNRLVKKFSTLKRGSEPILGGIEGWNYEASSMDIHRRETTSAAGNTYAFPEKLDSSGDRLEDDQPVHPRQEEDRASLSSLEIPYSVMGKLTVVNPDPCEEENEPIVAENPPQPEVDNEASLNLSYHDKDVPPSPEPPGPAPDDPPASPSDGESETNSDKPLPPRLGTPRFSQLVISDITISTPQVMEQPLPPLPPKEESPLPEATRSPLPVHPSEQPESSHLSTFDPFHIVNSISLDHTAHAPPSPTTTPVQTQVMPESHKKAPSQRKSASPPAVPSKPVVERRQTTVQRDLARQTSNRNAAPPEVTPTTEKKIGNLRSVNGLVSPSSRELHAEFKSPPSRTRSRSNSRSESCNFTAPVRNPPQVRVPFPASIEERHSFHADSPVSTSSMLANPPTPFDHRMSINVSDRSSTPPTVPPKSVRHQSPPPPRTTGTIKRQTETFRLVRSSSGNVYSSNQTILAQGQQWEVVESVEITKKDRLLKVKVDEKKFRDQGRERESDRERERDKERDLERERHRTRDLEREKQRAREREIELQKERAKEERERREAERIQRDSEIQKEKERAKERERREEDRIQRELEIQKEKAKERERREEERVQRELEIQREGERVKERERVQKELELRERTREWERREVEREKDRQREREKEKEREREQRQQERGRERQREKDRERERRCEKEKRQKERERREREKEKEKERERRREREREREERERWERERERHRKAQDRSLGEDPERRSGHNDRKSRDYNRKSRDYERRSRDYEPRTDGSEHKSPRTRDADRRPTGYDQSSKREPRTHEKSRHYEDSRPHDNHSHSRKYDEHHDRKSTRHLIEMSSSHSQYQRDPAIQPVPIPEPRLERIPTVSARPMSQLPSADEMNAVRAKEQWEMERLWKARSLHGLEPNGTANHVIPEHSSTSSTSDDIPEIIPGSPPQVHGSGHTAYLVPTPFHDSRPQIYRSMPTALPPIYYHSPASLPSIPDSLSSYEPYETLRFYPGPAQVAEPLPPPPFPKKSNNPLPEPPRESPYKPTPLPSNSPSKRRSTEYWTYNGITTAH